MRNIIILCSVLLIAIMSMAGKYFADLEGKDNNITKSLNFIPADAAMVFSFTNDASFYDIFKEYTLFDAIIGTKQQKDFTELQKFISQPLLKELVTDKKIVVSFHPVADSIEFLFTINLDKKFSVPDLEEVLTTLPAISLLNKKNRIFQLKSHSASKPIFIHFQKGAAFASYSSTLLSKCVTINHPTLPANFIAEINNASKKNQSSPINLFINHAALYKFNSHFLQNGATKNTALLQNLNGISSLSMNFKSDALMFNGISLTDTLQPQYLNLFLHQQATFNGIKNILPQNTSHFTAFGVSNQELFQKELAVYFEKKGKQKNAQKQLEIIQNATGVNPKRDLKPLWDKEFASVENLYGDAFAVIKVKNGRQTNFILQLLSTPLNSTISKLNYADIFYYYFGDPLKSFSKPYFGIVDNYLIVANTPNIVSNFLADYEQGRFLSQTESFKQYDQLLANESNILFFVQTENSKKTFKSTLKERYASKFGDNSYGLKNFYGFSYQWTGDKDHFFTNLYLSYPAAIKKSSVE